MAPLANAIKAKMPPSPLLSARKTYATYLSETISVSAQKISDRMPITFAGVTAMPYSLLKHSRMAYSGLVPISPYTTPSAASASLSW